MTEVDITGIGLWSEHFANWTEFCAVLDGASVPEGGKLSPELIPAKERRRAIAKRSRERTAGKN